MPKTDAHAELVAALTERGFRKSQFSSWTYYHPRSHCDVDCRPGEAVILRKWTGRDLNYTQYVLPFPELVPHTIILAAVDAAIKESETNAH